MRYSEDQANTQLHATAIARAQRSAIRAADQRRTAQRVSLDCRPRGSRRALQWLGTALIALVIACPMFVDALTH